MLYKSYAGDNIYFILPGMTDLIQKASFKRVLFQHQTLQYKQLNMYKNYMITQDIIYKLQLEFWN